MAEATFTISPATNDASIVAVDAVYATARAAASGALHDWSWPAVGQYYDSVAYYILRGYMSFDTSSLPDDASISAVELQIYITGKSGSSWSLQLQDGTPTYPHTPVEAGDYDQSNYSGDGGSLAVASITTGQYNTITLNATGRGWINKTGNTKFCIRSTEDIGDSAPTGYESCTIGQANAGATFWPKLVVTYTNVTYPTVSTDAASSIARTTVTLNGTLDDDGGEACNCCFEWGVNTTYGTTTAVQSKTTGQTFLQALTGMLPNTIYHYRSKSTNTAGTTYGADASFQMLAPQGGGIVSGLVGTLRHIWEPGMYRLEVGIGGYGLAMTTIPTGDAEDGTPEDPTDWIEDMMADAKAREEIEKVRVYLAAMRQYINQMYKPWSQKALSWEQMKSLAEYGPYQDVKDVVAAMTSWKAEYVAGLRGLPSVTGGAGIAPVAGIGAWSAIAGRIAGIGGIRHSPTTNELHISRKPYRPLSAGPNAVRLKEVTKSPQYLTYVTDVEFSSTDHDTVAWTSGLVKLSNGYIGPVASGGLDLTAAGRYYIYYTVGDNSLNNTVDFDTSLSSTSVLMAICEKVASGGKAIVFAPRSGISGYLQDTANISIAGATFTGNVHLDDGVTDSPILDLVDADDHYLRLQKLDAGYSSIYSEEGEVRIYASGSTSQWLDISTVSGNIVISSGASGNLCFDAPTGYVVCKDVFRMDDGSGDSPALDFVGYGASAGSLLIGKYSSPWGGNFKVSSDHPITFMPNNDDSDYISFSTASNIPRITGVGANLEIRSDGGTIDFNDEHLKTTGNLTDGTNALTVANAKTAYDHVSADGSSHTFLDQSVISGAAPTFTAANFSDGGTNAIITTTQETNFETAYSHVSLTNNPHTVTAAQAAAIATSLLTTRGDIIIRDASAPVRLAKGTEGQVLGMGANEPAWADAFDIFDKFREFIPWICLDAFTAGGDAGYAVTVEGPSVHLESDGDTDDDVWLKSTFPWSSLVNTGKTTTVELPISSADIKNATTWMRMSHLAPADPPSETVEHFGWKLIDADLYASCADGTTQEITDTGLNLTIATYYALKTVVLVGTSVKFYVDDVLKATHTTNPPDTDAGAYYIHYHVRNTAATSGANFYMARVLLEKEY